MPENRPTCPARLVIIECGASDVSRTVLRGAEGMEETPGGGPAELAERLLLKIATMERSGRRIEQAAIVVAPRRDLQSATARGLMARALLLHMMIAGGGELVLVAEATDVVARHELLTFAEGLLVEIQHGSVAIRVHFSEAGGKLDRIRSECQGGGAKPGPGAGSALEEALDRGLSTNGEPNEDHQPPVG